MRARAVLFDLDGTLADSAPAIAAALSELRVARGAGGLSAGRIRPWISLGAPELLRLSLAEAAGSPPEDLALFRARLMALPTPPDSLYPGVREMLGALVRGGLALAVVTNKPERLARKLLDELGLSPMLGAVVGGDTTAFAKPRPEPLTTALAWLGADLQGAVLVGDSAIDADAAAGLDMPFHLYEGGYGAAECEGRPVAFRFSQHVELADRLLAAAAAV